LYTDGAARGNPGPAAAGYRIVDRRGQLIAEDAEGLGRKTNNQAEYAGLIVGLKACRKYTGGRVRVGSDSELMMNHMRGIWKVKHPDLLPLYQEARTQVASFQEVLFNPYPRSHPEIARVDRALNELLDREVSESSGSAAV
jgi:ribonuclease HI